MKGQLASPVNIGAIMGVGIALIMIVVLQGFFANPISLPNFVDGFEFRTNFTITDTTANYKAFPIVVNPSDFTNFNCEGVRWTDDSNNLISFWRENCNTTPTENVTFYVVLQATDTLILYYGNTSVVSDLKSITDASVIGDDFDDGDFNLTKWSQSNTTGDIIESNGLLNMTASNVSNAFNRVLSIEGDIVSTGELIGRYSIDPANSSTGFQYHMLGLSSDFVWFLSDLASVQVIDDGVPTDIVNYQNIRAGVPTGVAINADHQVDTFMKYNIRWTAFNFTEYFKNDTFRANITTNNALENTNIFMTTENGVVVTQGDFWTAYDFVLVKNITTPEPLSSQGSEQIGSEVNQVAFVNEPDSISNLIGLIVFALIVVGLTAGIFQFFTRRK